MTKEIGTVLESSPNNIEIVIQDEKVFEENKKELQIGKYVEISDGNLNKVISLIQNIKSTISNDSAGNLKFILFILTGCYIEEGKFTRGASLIPSPTEPVSVIEKSSLDLIFSSNKEFNFPLGNLFRIKLNLKLMPISFSVSILP